MVSKEGGENLWNEAMHAQLYIILDIKLGMIQNCELCHTYIYTGHF